jgi:hypothetical protein
MLNLGDSDLSIGKSTARWSELGAQCGQVAAGFNVEMGAKPLRVEPSVNTVRVTLSVDDAQLFLQLDREARRVLVHELRMRELWEPSSWTSLRSESSSLTASFDSPTLEAPMSEEELAIELLTAVTGTDEPKP